MSWDGTFKYEPVNPSKVNEILTEYKDQPVLGYILELYRLIEYQRNLINQQEKQLIALKHSEAWKHYEKPDQFYDPKTRQYSNKPLKSSDNRSC
jgi:hypothetical protein